MLGKNLVWVKEDIGHGNFEQWIDENIWFSIDTAQRMMAFAIRCDDDGKLIEYHPRKEEKNVTVTFLIPGTYKTIVIDPPWPIEKIERYERPHQKKELDYPTMTIEAIKEIKLPIAGIIFYLLSLIFFFLLSLSQKGLLQ